MLGLIVRRRTAAMFDLLSGGEWEAIVDQLADDVQHVFPGSHPLGGERRSRAAVLSWFERLGRLYPGHDFELHRIAWRGPPWDMWIVARWTAHLRPKVGPPYANEGTHWIHVRWGKATHFHAYLDTQLIADACDRMAEAGIAEAAAAPIGG